MSAGVHACLQVCMQAIMRESESDCERERHTNMYLYKFMCVYARASVCEYVYSLILLYYLKRKKYSP